MQRAKLDRKTSIDKSWSMHSDEVWIMHPNGGDHILQEEGKALNRDNYWSWKYIIDGNNKLASFILLLFAQSRNPLKTTLANRLEACQRFAARVILQSWNLNHEDLLQKSNLPCSPNSTLCHLDKIVHHISSSPYPYNPHPAAFTP